jgi:hypothetical protein
MKFMMKTILIVSFFTVLTSCVSTQARKRFSQSRYGGVGSLADAPNNQPSSRLDQVRRNFNTPRF